MDCNLKLNTAYFITQHFHVHINGDFSDVNRTPSTEKGYEINLFNLHKISNDDKSNSKHFIDYLLPKFVSKSRKGCRKISLDRYISMQGRHCEHILEYLVQIKRKNRTI